MKPVTEYSFGNLEPFFGSTPNLTRLCSATRSDNDVTKTFFSNQFNRVSWIINKSKQVILMRGEGGRGEGGNQEVKKSEAHQEVNKPGNQEVKKSEVLRMLFFVLFCPSWARPNSSHYQYWQISRTISYLNKSASQILSYCN